MEGTRDTGHGAPGGHRTRGHRESRREIGFTDCALGPLRDYGPASGAQVCCRKGFLPRSVGNQQIYRHTPR